MARSYRLTVYLSTTAREFVDHASGYCPRSLDHARTKPKKEKKKNANLATSGAERVAGIALGGWSDANVTSEGLRHVFDSEVWVTVSRSDRIGIDRCDDHQMGSGLKGHLLRTACGAIGSKF